jgi:hypothetical protein
MLVRSLLTGSNAYSQRVLAWSANGSGA